MNRLLFMVILSLSQMLVSQSSVLSIDPNPFEPFILITSGSFYFPDSLVHMDEVSDSLKKKKKKKMYYSLGPNVVDAKGVFISGVFLGTEIKTTAFNTSLTGTYQNLEIEDVRKDQDIYKSKIKIGRALYGVDFAITEKGKYSKNRKSEHEIIISAEENVIGTFSTQTLSFTQEINNGASIGAGMNTKISDYLDFSAEYLRQLNEEEDYNWSVGATTTFKHKKNTIGKLRTNLNNDGTVVLTFIALF